MFRNPYVFMPRGKQHREIRAGWGRGGGEAAESHWLSAKEEYLFALVTVSAT